MRHDCTKRIFSQIFMTGRNPVIEALSHIFKYPTNDVCGLFVESKSNPGTICGCIPLFHSPCVTAPIMRSSMALVEGIEDRVVVAMYYASSDNINVPRCVDLLKSQIQKMMNISVPLVRFDPESFEKNFEAFVVESSEKSLRNETFKLNVQDMDVTKSNFSIRSHISNLFDFEDHLNDPSGDWLRYV
jgi:hypothetical protein